MIIGATDPCPKCGARLEIVNKTVKMNQMADGRIGKIIERFNWCTNHQCDFKQTLGSAFHSTV